MLIIIECDSIFFFMNFMSGNLGWSLDGKVIVYLIVLVIERCRDNGDCENCDFVWFLLIVLKVLEKDNNRMKVVNFLFRVCFKK